MKLPEDEQRAYDHYQDDLHYQASMFQSSFGDGYYEGTAKGKIEAAKEMVKNLAKEDIPIKTIIKVTGLTKAEIERILEQADKKINTNNDTD